MKVIIASLLLVLGLAFFGQAAGEKTRFSDFSVTNNHTVITNIVSTNIWCRKVTLLGLKAGGVNNAATVYVGSTSNQAYFAISAGGTAVIEPDPGTLFNLKDWYLRTPTTGDGIFIMYQ